MPLNLGADEAVNQEEGDRVEKAITADASLEAAQDNLGAKKPWEVLLLRLGLGEMLHTGSDEGRITLAALMETCTILSDMITHLETKLSTTKAVYNKAFITLTKRVKKLESQLKQKSRAVIHSQMKKDQLYAEELAKEEARQKQERYNLEKALELQRQLDQRKENVPKGDQAKEIDWNDPQVLRYHALQNRHFSKTKVKKNMIMYLKNQGGYKQSYFKRMKCEDIRPLFERIWDQVHTFVPKDFKI
uniref:Uncharacterized protein n=1 Tax=Tanacetum cinerariifolium TaxID=118510 RepID=A0A699JPU2_TANCI|nr:hypothetical protein [Tanacetum cinerariifolium]GFA56825.1 hypothetical protein [Tanacetum cinerariifolium]